MSLMTYIHTHITTEPVFLYMYIGPGPLDDVRDVVVWDSENGERRVVAAITGHSLDLYDSAAVGVNPVMDKREALDRY